MLTTTASMSETVQSGIMMDRSTLPVLGKITQDQVNQLVLDGTYLYWTTDSHPRQIFRYPLGGGNPEVIVESTFPNGVINTGPLVQNHQWLIFIDAAGPSLGEPWQVRSFNLQDHSMQTLYESKNGEATFNGYDADNDQLILSIVEPRENAHCDETVLLLLELSTNEHKEVEHLCIQDNYMWTFPNLSGEHLVLEKDWSDSKGSGNDIVLYNLSSHRFTALTNNHRSGSPDIDWPWVTWKDAPRYEEAKSTVVQNLQTGKQQIVPMGYDSTFLTNQHWLLWWPRPLSGLYVYDLLSAHFLLIANPGDNQSFGVVALQNNTIAWWRNLDYEHASLHGVLEWQTLPTAEPSK